MSRGSDTRFKKGQSGNPKGRPRKTKVDAGESAFQVIFDQTVTVTEAGKPRTLSAEEALQLRTYQEALKGSKIAQRTIMKMIAKREAWLAKHAPPARKIETKRTYSDSQGRARQAMLVLGIFCPEDESDIGRVQMEQWAFRAALDRDRSLQLGVLERARMRVSVRDWSSVDCKDRYIDDGR